GTIDGAVLAVTIDETNGRTHQITDGLHISPGQAIGSPIVPFGYGTDELMTVSPWVSGDRIYILTRNALDVLTTTGSRVASYTLPKTIAIAAHPADDHALIMDDDGQLWRLGYTGTLTAAGAANVDTSDYWLITATNPTAPSWRVSAADNATPAATALRHDATG